MDDTKEPTAEEARDEALERVLKNAGPKWSDICLSLLRGFPDDWVGIGEDVRHAMTDLGHVPHNPGAWGSLIRTAMRRGIIHPTGSMAKPKDVKSHARSSKQYRRSNKVSHAVWKLGDDLRTEDEITAFCIAWLRDQGIEV